MPKSRLPQRAASASEAIEALIAENGRLNLSNTRWQNTAITVVSCCMLILIGTVWVVERRNDDQQAMVHTLARNLSEVEHSIAAVTRAQSELDPRLFTDTMQLMHRMLEQDGLLAEEIQALEHRLDRIRASL